MASSFKLTQILIAVIAATVALSQAYASNLDQDLDSLGGNEQILQRAEAMDPHNRVEAVQNRTVDLHNRIEIGGNYGLVAGGDSYLETQNLGLNLDYHINPHWSLGARYYSSMNTLTPEGKAVFNNAQSTQQATGNFSVPAIDSPLSTYLAVVDFYPIYGKMNLFDQAITQFDLYTLGGFGKVNLTSGQSNAYTAGAGIAFWFTQHFSTRFEGRWETYQDQNYQGTRNLNAVITTISLGLLI